MSPLMSEFFGLPLFYEFESFEECWSSICSMPFSLGLWCLPTIGLELWIWGKKTNRAEVSSSFHISRFTGDTGITGWVRLDQLVRVVVPGVSTCKWLCFPFQTPLFARRSMHLGRTRCGRSSYTFQSGSVNLEYLEIFCKKDLWHTVFKGIKLFM